MRCKRLAMFMCGCCLSAALAAAPPKRDYILFEYGISMGAAHYFGDLNLGFKFDKPGYAFGLWGRYNLNDYVAFRLSLSAAHVGYDDKLNKNDPYLFRRNLNFESDLWEAAVQGDFNFYSFIPKNKKYLFTTYVTLGIGLTFFDPYTSYRGEKYLLRFLGTEGQDVSGGKPAYGNVAVCFPLGVGVKFNLGRYVNMGFEAGYRFLTTDYLDDVSGVYAGNGRFSPGAPAYALQDRSGEISAQPLGRIAGKQRGDSYQLDGYGFASLFITFNIIHRPECPDDGAYKYPYRRSRKAYKNPRSLY